MNPIRCTPAVVLVLSWLVLSVTVGHLSGATADRPNVLLIMTDNHGAWTLGCYGNQDIRTPHIDRLAREGILFTRCYSSTLSVRRRVPRGSLA